jgi:hypothetical protein
VDSDAQTETRSRHVGQHCRAVIGRHPKHLDRATLRMARHRCQSDREAKIAKAIAERPVPTIDQVRHVLQNMPAGLVAFG